LILGGILDLETEGTW